MEKCFNPLSTGHAPVLPGLYELDFSGFNPLSTGHAPRMIPGDSHNGEVSIPYLRVTHQLREKSRKGLRLVSIPYLRVTHLCLLPFSIVFVRVSIPYLRVTHFAIIGRLMMMFVFQSPIYGSRTPPFPGRLVACRGFNPLSTGHALTFFSM